MKNSFFNWKEADIALGPFGLTASRASVVKFSNPVIIDYYRILLKRSTPVADPWSFLKPFGPLVRQLEIHLSRSLNS